MVDAQNRPEHIFPLPYNHRCPTSYAIEDMSVPEYWSCVRLGGERDYPLVDNVQPVAGQNRAKGRLKGAVLLADTIASTLSCDPRLTSGCFKHMKTTSARVLELLSSSGSGV